MLTVGCNFIRTNIIENWGNRESHYWRVFFSGDDYLTINYCTAVIQ